MNSKICCLIKSRLLLFVWFFQSLPLINNAQQENKTQYLSIAVNIVMEDTTLIKGASIKFQMNKDDINTGYTRDLSNYEFQITGVITKIKIPLNTQFNYGTISFYSPFFLKSNNAVDEVGVHGNLSRSLYVFQAGDSINIDISADTILFSGKGCGKYRCITRLNKQDHGNVYKIGKPISPGMQKDNLLQAYFDKEYLFYQHKLDILTEYKSQVNKQIYSMIAIDLWGEYNGRLINILYSKSVPYRTRMNEWHGAVEKALSDLTDKLNHEKFDEIMLIKSYKYCDFLYKRVRLETILQTKPEEPYYNLGYSFKELFGRIQGKYNGLIYDKLILVTFLSELKSRNDINQYLGIATKEMGATILKIKMQRLAQVINGSAFPFSLPDETGRIYKLDDFKGKLIVMDFWFTGCSGCIALAEQMKPIISLFKSDSNVVFISVCVDKNRETWLRSLMDEKYSSPDELNLYTDGLATDHPILTHYNVSGFPFLLVISKEGSVLSTTPPRPLENVRGSSDAFINFINGYL